MVALLPCVKARMYRSAAIVALVRLQPLRQFQLVSHRAQVLADDPHLACKCVCICRQLDVQVT